MSRIEQLAEGVTLYLSDCRDILPSLGKVDAVVTDPPYGILSEGSAATKRGGWNEGFSWDESAPSAGFMAQILGAGECSLIWGGCHMELPPTLGYLIWDKGCEGLNFGEVEYCWTSLKFAPRMFRFRAAGMDGGKEHPTQKPIQVMRWCLGFVPKANTILDPFMGSGTTGIAAIKLGRKFLGIEIEPKYFDIACRRISEALKQPDMFIEPPKSIKQEAFDYDANKDFAGSLQDGYSAIKERVAAGGPGWEPK